MLDTGNSGHNITHDRILSKPIEGLLRNGLSLFFVYIKLCFGTAIEVIAVFYFLSM